MNMACNPLIKTGCNPKSVYTASNDAKQEPLDPITKQLVSASVKAQTSAVNDRVLNDKFHHIADSPGSCDTAGKGSIKQFGKFL